MKKKFFLGLIVLLLCSACFAKTKVADLGDVRIYSLGSGYFEVESDRAQQCFALTFRESGGWIEVACSSYVRKVTSGSVGEAVKWVVTSYLGGSKWAGDIAGSVAGWAANKGMEYLCD